MTSSKLLIVFGIALASASALADVTRYDGGVEGDVARWDAAVAKGLKVAADATVALTNGTFAMPATAPSFADGSTFRVERGATLFATNSAAGFNIASTGAQVVLDGGAISNRVDDKTVFFTAAARDSRISLTRGASWLMPDGYKTYFHLSGEGNTLALDGESYLRCYGSANNAHVARNLKFYKAKGCCLTVTNATVCAMGLCFGNPFKGDAMYNTAGYVGYAVCNTVLLHNATCSFYDSSLYGIVMGRVSTLQPDASTNNLIVVSGDATHTTDVKGLHIDGVGDTFRLEGTRLSVRGWGSNGIQMLGVSNRLELVGGKIDTVKIIVAGEGCWADVGPAMSISQPVSLGEAAARSLGSTYRVRGTSSGAVTVRGLDNTLDIDGGTQSGAITMGGTNSTLRLANGGSVGAVTWGEGTIHAATPETFALAGKLTLANADAGATNVFTGVAGSTIVISGEVTATGDPVLDIASGRVKFASALTSGQKIVVRSGATLELTQGDWQSLALTLEDGARLIASVTVPYDPATDATTPVAIPAALEASPDEPLPVRLSAPIPLPKAGASLAVVTFDASENLDVTCFRDATEKTYGLPRTSLEIREAGGVKTLYMNVRPTVVSVTKFGNTLNINGSAATWSGGNKAEAGSDYLLTNTVESIGASVTFAGDSLTVAPPASLGMRSTTHSLKTATGEKVVVYPGVGTTQSWNGRDMILKGDIDLPGAYGDAGYFNFYLKYGEYASYHGTLRLDATVTGSGTLRVTGAANGRSMNGIGGDLSGFTGQILVDGRGSTFDNATHVRVYDQKNLGGRLSAFEDEAVSVSTCGAIRPERNLTLVDDVNRGFFFDTGAFDCPTGVTLTTWWPIKLKTRLGKTGAGTLLLGGAVTHAGTTKALRVDEGAVGFLTDAAAAGFNATFSNDTAIVLSATAAVTNGLTGTLAVTEAAEGVAGRVRVRLDRATVANAKAPVRAVICTLPEAVDAASLFALQRLKGYLAPVLATERVTLNGAAHTRYVYTADPSGAFVIIR